MVNNLPSGVVLKPCTVYLQNGTTETVYIDATPFRRRWTDHLTVVYMVVGTMALGMTAFLAYKNLQHLKA